MVTRSPEQLAHDGLTPLERELALASFGPEGAPGAEPAAASAPADTRHAPHNPHLEHWRTHLHTLATRSQRALPLRPCGRLTRAAGLVLEAIGLRLSVGAECTIELPPAARCRTRKRKSSASPASACS